MNLSTYSVFESMRAYQGRIFKFDAHLKRLYESSKTVMLKLPADRSKIKMRISRALDQSGLKDAYIRISAREKSKRLAGIEIIIKDIKIYPQDFYRKGVEVVGAAVKRDFINTLTPSIKSANFLGGILAKIEANRQGAFEALLLNHQGYVTEGTVSNIFIVKGKKLFTPSLSCGALGGITRKVVIDLAEKLSGIKFKETLITRHDIYTADEAFLTNTSIEIMPVTSVDARAIGDGRPGRITKRLIAGFKELVGAGRLCPLGYAPARIELTKTCQIIDKRDGASPSPTTSNSEE